MKNAENFFIFIFVLSLILMTGLLTENTLTVLKNRSVPGCASCAQTTKLSTDADTSTLAEKLKSSLQEKGIHPVDAKYWKIAQ